ncbi:CDP-alcohol phosphatidyltransferase family protein [Marinilabilia rubra]|uniref:CDP-alcohol phosphatidyltransferase n=1 Tax=Marinilabilia rubra TaxID=2162893 RepID=A0A2U2BDT5_9BACT|nr:CDP-alcohol phosphatidyltransferase family protein [Marinilabilia rubra]PWE01221.1 CDP-alcohol phosphatidyltransferase [Marinilabilia rubra]
MRIVKIIPNTLTSLNLFFGATGMLLAFQGRPDLTAWCILIAAVFDFTDGFAARMLNAYSDIGKELDSLADLISFGLAPAAAFVSLLSFHFTGSWRLDFFEMEIPLQFVFLLPFVLTVFSALRLAKFNIDTRQTESFLGLTTTAAGMFSVSLIHLIFTREGGWTALSSPYVIFPLIVVFCYLLVSEIPMFSLKFKSFGFKDNVIRYLLLLVGLVAIIAFGVGGIAVTILGYILFSVGGDVMDGKK